MLKILVGVTWATLAVVLFVWWRRSGLSPSELPGHFIERVERFGELPAALVFLGIYSIRPLIFTPSTPMVLLSGFLFGPWWGILLALTAETIGSNAALIMARYLGRSVVSRRESAWLIRWDDRLRKRGFITVLVFRLLYLPYDTVSFGCGLTAVKQRDFTLATAIGSLPWVITLSLLGGSASADAGAKVHILGMDIPQQYLLWAISITIFLAGLVVALLLRRRWGKPAEHPGESKVDAL